MVPDWTQKLQSFQCKVRFYSPIPLHCPINLIVHDSTSYTLYIDTLEEKEYQIDSILHPVVPDVNHDDEDSGNSSEEEKKEGFKRFGIFKFCGKKCAKNWIDCDPFWGKSVLMENQ